MVPLNNIDASSRRQQRRRSEVELERRREREGGEGVRASRYSCDRELSRPCNNSPIGVLLSKIVVDVRYCGLKQSTVGCGISCPLVGVLDIYWDLQ